MSDHQIPPGSAVVTPAQMFAEIRATHQEVRDVKVLIEGLSRPVEDHENRLRELERHADGGDVAADVVDHENRLRVLERSKWLLVGFAASGGGAVGSIITKLLGG